MMEIDDESIKKQGGHLIVSPKVIQANPFSADKSQIVFPTCLLSAKSADLQENKRDWKRISVLPNQAPEDFKQKTPNEEARVKNKASVIVNGEIKRITFTEFNKGSK